MTDSIRAMVPIDQSQQR